MDRQEDEDRYIEGLVYFCAGLLRAVDTNRIEKFLIPLIGQAEFKVYGIVQLWPLRDRLRRIQLLRKALSSVLPVISQFLSLIFGFES